MGKAERWVARRRPAAGTRQFRCQAVTRKHQEEALSLSRITHLRHVEDTGDVRLPGMVAVARHHGDPRKGDSSCCESDRQQKARVKPEGLSQGLSSCKGRTEEAQTKPRTQQSQWLRFKED